MNGITSFSAKLATVSSTTALHIWRGFSTMASTPKVSRIIKKIGTHSGVFHCDEALACFMLKQLPEYADAEIIRTRDNNILAGCDIVVDVGGDYDPKKHRYDHHQRDFDETISTVRPDLIKNKTIKLSSAGLVYAHFGLEVLTEVLNKHNIIPSPDCLHSIFAYVYEVFVEEMDAIDNGVPMFTEGKPKYRINTHLSARVHRLNPEWNSPNPIPNNETFYKAMELTGNEFVERVLDSVNVWWPARSIVKNAIINRHKINESGQIVELGERCPWKDHLLSLEEEMGISGDIKFVVFHDAGDSWRVQAIPIQPDSFICRIFLHKDWRGVRDEELSNIAKIENCVFCHATGFIGGNKTRDGALEMAVKSIQAHVSDQE